MYYVFVKKKVYTTRTKPKYLSEKFAKASHAGNVLKIDHGIYEKNCSSVTSKKLPNRLGA